MADWALGEQGVYHPLFEKHSTEPFTTPPIDTTTPHAWTEVKATTEHEYHGLWIQNPGGNNGAAGTVINGDYALYFAIGAAASEQMILDGLVINHVDHRHGDGSVFVPLYVPKGVRLSMGGMLVGGGSGISTLHVQVYGQTKGWHGEKGFTRSMRLGSSYHHNHFSNGDPVVYSRHLGSHITLPTTGSIDRSLANWEEVHNEVPFDVKYIMPYGHQASSTVNEFGHANAPANSGRSFFWELGIGAAGDEVAITPAYHQQIHVASFWNGEFNSLHPGLPCYIPRGSRLVARAVTNYATSSENGMSIFCHAFG